MGQKTTKLLNKAYKQTMLYLFSHAMGHHALARRSTSLSDSAMKELWLNGEDERKGGGCGWLERQRVLRNPWVA